MAPLRQVQDGQSELDLRQRVIKRQRLLSAKRFASSIDAFDIAA
jgi:hypothetical protein